MITISGISREVVRVPVAAVDTTGAVNPTTGTCDVALVAASVDTSTAATWAALTALAAGSAAAAWETISGVYHVSVTIGGSSSGATIAVADGLYVVWVRVQLAGEALVAPVGRLTIT